MFGLSWLIVYKSRSARAYGSYGTAQWFCTPEYGGSSQRIWSHVHGFPKNPEECHQKLPAENRRLPDV